MECLPTTGRREVEIKAGPGYAPKSCQKLHSYVDAYLSVSLEGPVEGSALACSGVGQRTDGGVYFSFETDQPQWLRPRPPPQRFTRPSTWFPAANCLYSSFSWPAKVACYSAPLHDVLSLESATSPYAGEYELLHAFEHPVSGLPCTMTPAAKQEIGAAFPGCCLKRS